MIKIIGVRFRNVGKVYYFDPQSLDIKLGDHVIVETARGVEYGYVVLGPKEVEDSKVVQPLKEVLRIATDKMMRRKRRIGKKKKKRTRFVRKRFRLIIWR